MEELVRTNDAVFLSWLTAHLGGQGIDAIVLDTHTSVMEGSISAIPRRVMVKPEDMWRAKKVLAEAEEIQAGEGVG
ncbi:MAG: DUF2007 domain-containing protein [Alphaproteobacteria bacterium]|nr:DUF2007 domain-containing protein [Alphaproteobacteria bacterium]